MNDANFADVKHRLATAQTEEERLAAIDFAIEEGMPIAKIREFLDWLDAQRDSDGQP